MNVDQFEIKWNPKKKGRQFKKLSEYQAFKDSSY